MASRKKESEGIASLSIYFDEDDEEMGDIEEDDHQQDQQGDEEKRQPLKEENEYRESNNMEKDSRNNDNAPPFPRQTNSSPQQHQRRGRGRLTIVDYGHDETALSPEPEEGELGDSEDVMFGIEHQIGDLPAAPRSSELEPLQPETVNNAVSESEVVEVKESIFVDHLDKFLPVPPKADCSEDLQRKIYKFLNFKRAGKSFNADIRSRKDYRNPDFLLHSVRYQDIDQIGSCFSKDVFDPHGYDKSDYFDEIEADMKHERERKEQEGKKSQKVEFASGRAVLTAPKVGMPIAAVASGGLPTAVTAVDNIARDDRQNKKSKWDKVDSDGRNPLPAGAQDSLSTVGAHTVLLSAANAGIGYTAFALQKGRKTEEKRSNE